VFVNVAVSFLVINTKLYLVKEKERLKNLRDLLLIILYQHSAAVIGRKMVVVGGDSDNGMLDDFQVIWNPHYVLHKT
jgi:hypothetical protein